VEDTLQRLLAAEQHAEKLVDEAKARRDRITSKAIDDTRRAQRRFEARIPEIHSSFVDKAESRAAQMLKELERRYSDRQAELKELAAEHRKDAVEAILQLLTDPDRS